MPYIGQGLQQGRRQLHTFTATASQTTFNVAYSPGFVDVYQNGILLAPSDYTATNGTSIVLGVGAAVNDEITIIAQHLFSVADSVSASQGGTFTGDVTMTGNLTVQGTTITVDTSTAQTLAMGDADKISLGDNADLQIYHEPTYNNGIIVESGSGNLLLGGNHINLRDSTLNTTMANFNPNSSADLYYAGTKVFGTTATGIDIANGTGTIFNNSGTFTIDANTNLTLRGGIHTFDNADGSVEYARITSSGNVSIGGTANEYTNYTTLTINHNTNGGILDIERNGNLVGELYTSSATDFGIQTGQATGAMRFRTNAGEVLTLLHTGNVGIGQINPSYKLEVSGTGDTVQYIANANPSGTQGRTLLIRDNYASSSQDSKISFSATSSPGQDVYLGKRTTSNAGYFHLTNSSGTEHMTVNMANGYVGIGETSSENILHIKTSASGGPQIELDSTSGTANSAFINFDGTSLQLSTQRDMVDGSKRDTAKSWGGINIVGATTGSYIQLQTSEGNNNAVSTKLTVESNGDTRIVAAQNYVGGAPGGGTSRFSVLNADSGKWVSQMRSDNTGGHGLFVRAGNTASTYTAHFTGYDEANVHMSIDGLGRVTMPKQPSFSAVYNGSSWSTSSGSTMIHNYTGNGGHNIGNHYSTSTGRFTAPVDGTYHFDWYSICVGTYSNAYIQFYKNGARMYGGDIHITKDESGWETYNWNRTIYLSAGDYIEPIQVGTMTWHGNHWNNFGGYLVG